MQDAEEYAVGAAAVSFQVEFDVDVSLIDTMVRRRGLNGTVALCGVGQAEAADVPGRSDGEGEFGERGRHPVACRYFGPEFVVAAPQVLHEGVPGGDDPQPSGPV